MHQTLWITGAATTVNVGCIYLFDFGILGAVVLNHIGFFIGLGNTMLPLYKIKESSKRGISGTVSPKLGSFIHKTQ